MDPDGSNQVRVTDLAAVISPPLYQAAYEPDWSPDGQRLIYTAGNSSGDTRRTLATFEFNTSEARFLIDAAARDDDPNWSPEGTRVAFDSDRAGTGDFDLYVFDLVSGELRQITSGPGSDVAPTWQPRR